MKMEENEIFSPFDSREKGNLVQIAKKMCAVYGDDAVADAAVRKRFARFRSKNFDLEDCERSNRSTIADNAQIKMLIKINPGHMTQDIADILHISHMSVVRHLRNNWIRKSL
ncbi:uncharacterized protein LOC106869913 [Octopus bimaculoides]|uniref:uncharacterized protein LOC106869913 n=1 Tax=Octopus bimaculoides TaxID=37653 RepID=UPI00071DF34F|nr:uncharacterized protein LOC106869913 [Octopus bimaculoides]|eukprot:XP_014771331.1 PREDICTED: uncharacterized protein LOC106869913 [Octopus bimaculoides]